MNIKDFIKEKILSLSLIIFSLLTIEIFLMAYPYGNFIKLYIPIVIIGIYIVGILFEYFQKKKYYLTLQNMLDELNEKYLITEIITKPNFIEGRILKDILQQIDKSMIESVNKYKHLQEDYKEYIEVWIHEIKIPIASRKNGN